MIKRLEDFQHKLVIFNETEVSGFVLWKNTQWKKLFSFKRQKNWKIGKRREFSFQVWQEGKMFDLSVM